MLTDVFATAAVVLTVARSFPQYLRIVLKGDRQGVSVGTWSISIANHVGWLVFGSFELIPSIIVANVLSAIGCAAIVWTLRGKFDVAKITAATLVTAGVLYAIRPGVLLAALTIISISSFLPQLIKMFQTDATGVSSMTWGIASVSSASWLLWAFSISHVTYVLHHFLIFPGSTIIFVRAVMAHVRHRGDRELQPAA